MVVIPSRMGYITKVERNLCGLHMCITLPSFNLGDWSGDIT